MKRTGISIVFPALLLALFLCFCAYEEKTVGPKAEYDLPGKATVQDEKIESRSESVYDEQGNRTVWVYYDGNGKESARNECL